MPSFDAKKFAEWITAAYEQSPFKSFSQLGAAVGVSRATISNLMGAKEQVLTGKASQPKAELVEKLAISLGKDVDEALILAGHAPRNIVADIPKPILEALAREGKLSPNDEIFLAELIVKLKKANG